MIFLSFILFTACPEDPEPDPRDTSIFLELESTWTSSLTLKVSVADTSDFWSFSLSRDDSTIGAFSVYGNDTLIKDGDLEPNRDYTYRAYWLDGVEVQDSSNQIIATTMDTTSHHFTWIIDTLGSYGSYLRDVAIVDENNIWVVGNIETDSGRYNAAHWDGNEWVMKRFLYNGIVSQGRAIYTWDDYILISAGTLFSSPDGTEWDEWDIDIGTFPGGINAIWGSAPDDVYFVGDNGSIVHYDGGPSQGGQGFERMESGTDVSLDDIWGNTNASHIWASGFVLHNVTSTLLHYDGSSWEVIYEVLQGVELELNTGFSDRIISVWSNVEDTIYILSEYGLYHQPMAGGQDKRYEPLAFQRGPFRLRGNNQQDMLVVGEDGMIWHYNGANWNFYEEVYTPGYRLKSVSIKEDIAVIVGVDYSESIQKDVIIIGRRNP